MHRIVILLLAALDALIAAAVGIAFVLAPLALFWATTDGTAWGDLWPTAASIWQLGHLVPLHITLPAPLLVSSGVAADAATFVVSLAPLAFAAFVAVFAARSGVRAARSRGWAVGVLSGGIVFAVVAALVQLTSGNDLAATTAWQGILFPTLVYLVPLLLGAVVTAWIDGDDGLLDYVHDRLDAREETWSELPAVIGRGIGVVVVGFVALGALAVLVSVVTRGGEVIALLQSNRVDLWGAILLALVHLVYVPTLIVWGMSWIAGPGFFVGDGATVTPAGLDVGVLPSLPIFGLIPAGGGVWLYAVVLLPIALAALAGWAMRSRYVAVIGDNEPLAPRLVALGALTAVSTGAIVAVGALASGSIGPGRMAHLGVPLGPLAITVALEVAIGAGIMLLAPRREGRSWRFATDDDTASVGIDTRQ